MSAQPPEPQSHFEVVEATISDAQRAMQAGELTARQLVQLFLSRIEAYDKQGPAINALIELDPDALTVADALDAERDAEGARSPLHGIPVILKDNIDTADRTTTTAGSLALEGSNPGQDSHVAKRLREAGAVLLGKANLSEWANFRSSRSTSGWSGRGGRCRNPYSLDRNPCGSSSGSGGMLQSVAMGPPAEWWANVMAGWPRRPSHSCSGVSNSGESDDSHGPPPSSK